MWHVSNEYCGACYCQLCQQAFRDWLKQKYGSLESLNHAWWNDFWSHTITDWDQIEAPSQRTDLSTKGKNLDWKRFVTEQTISFIDNEIAPLKKYTPHVPVTINMMAGEPGVSPFEELDYQKIAKHLDIISLDIYPKWGNDTISTAQLGSRVAMDQDFFRSLKHQNYLIMENTPSRVNWQPINRAKLPGMHEIASLQEIAHGSNSICYFQLRASRGSAEMFHGAVIEHRQPEKKRVFADVTQVGKDLNNLQEVLATNYAPSKVAIFFSYDNYWSLQDAEAYTKEDKKIWSTIQKHYDYFYQHDIPVDFVSPSDDLGQYQLIIDPMHFMMSKQYMEKLHAFVKNGGTVVGTYITGVVDENDLAYMDEWPRELQDVYWVEPIETDVLYPSQSGSIKFENK